MRLIYCFLALLCHILCNATQVSLLKPLAIGDNVPDILFTNIINPISIGSKNAAANLSSFKGKLILLDFWATNCSACIQKLPMLDSLQKIYSNDFTVLLISSSSSDTKEKVLKLFNRIKMADNISIGLSAVLDDTIANKLFPHIYVPHYAWLDSSLKVIAITGGEDVTIEKINRFILKEPVDFSYKEDIINFNPEQRLFLNGNGGSGASIKISSLLSSYIPGLPSGSYISKNETDDYTRIMLANQPVLELLMRANDYFYDPKRFHFPTDNDEIKTEGKSEEWIIRHSYTYELNTIPVPKLKALKYMQEDIQRYLGYSAIVKRMLTNCYVLTIDSSVLKKHITKGKAEINNLAEPVNRCLQNRPVSDIVEFLDNLLLLPVVDESGFSKDIDIVLSDREASDIETLKTAFSKYGIYLTKSSRMLNNFFIYHHLPN